MPEPDRRTDDAHVPGEYAAGAPAERQLPTEPADRPNGEEGSEDGSIDFQQLAQGRREILVRLAGQTYRLRWTRNDKLILTK